MREPTFEGGGARVFHGDCIEVMREMPDASVHAIVTDPPYGLEFMGKDWDGADGFRRSLNEADAGRESVFGRTSRTSPEYNTGRGARVAAERATELTPKGKGHSTSAGPYLAAGVDSIRVAGVPFQEWCTLWAAEALRVLRPGGYLLSFGGSRTWHRLAVAVEDAGFEIRDSIAWLYGSGFPKSRNLDGEWAGWGTALKPAFEPIVVARKPLMGTVAVNIRAHGTGALNIDATRVAMSDADADAINAKHAGMDAGSYERPVGVALNLSVNPMPLKPAEAHELGRWPANVVLDEDQASALDAQTPESASRYFPTFRYEAKAGSAERPEAGGVQHPTVKPLDLMRWLVRLVASPGAVILEPFAGSGTTVEACIREGFECIAIEREASYLPLIEARLRKDHQQSLFADLEGGDAA